MTELNFSPINAQQVNEIMTWHYEKPYDIYDMGPADDQTLPYFLDPQNAFHAITDPSDDLVGFCSFGPDGQVPGGDYSVEALTQLGVSDSPTSHSRNAQQSNDLAADSDLSERDLSGNRYQEREPYLSRKVVDIGLGVRPDLTGQGNGSLFIAAVLDFSRQRFAPQMFRVTVADFNKRAWRVWSKAGFQPVETFASTYDGMLFVILRQCQENK